MKSESKLEKILESGLGENVVNALLCPLECMECINYNLD